MSRMQHSDAKLRFYKGPIFPDSLMRVMQMQDSAGLNGCGLKALGEKLPGFVREDRVRTTDGYTWFWALYFKANQGEVAVLFPWAQDWDQSDGSQSDRSMAVHVQGNVSDDSIDKLLGQIADLLSEY